MMALCDTGARMWSVGALAGKTGCTIVATMERPVASVAVACGAVWVVSPWKGLLVVVSIANAHPPVRCITMQPWAAGDPAAFHGHG